jgi:hypothetical protein
MANFIPVLKFPFLVLIASFFKIKFVLRYFTGYLKLSLVVMKLPV